MSESQGVWEERDTSPTKVDAALRELLRARHHASEAFVPARVLNLVVVADREWRGEIQNRLDRVGRFHASRTILCAVEDGRTTIDARASVTAPDDEDHEHGDVAVGHEQVVLDVGPKHLIRLATIVDPLVVSDLPTVVWSPHDHPEAIDALLPIAQVVLLDSINAPRPTEAVERARELAERSYVVDLAWLRSTPWRERVASTFDPARWRPELRRFSAVTVRHGPESTIAGLLFLGWLAHRLGWEAGPMTARDGTLQGTAHGRRQDVMLRLDTDETMTAPGLSGITIATTSGIEVSLDRGAGGLHARRRGPKRGEEREWTVMGSSRGESGILGEGIRQALLRDRSYGPALRAVVVMVD